MTATKDTAAHQKESKIGNAVLDWIDTNAEAQVELLRQAVAIPSVSAWKTHRAHSQKCAEFFAQRFQSLGFETEFRQPKANYKEGTETVALPPVVLARLPVEDSSKPTVVIYGHLDVQPAAKSDGWDTEPFELIERHGKLYGRGSTDDKGPVLAWTNAIEAMRKCSVDIPVNPRFILEGMEESGSEGLEELLRAMKEEGPKSIFTGVDHCVISDSYWLGNKKPCLSYGLRGNCCFAIEIQCAKKDLHSGCCGSLVTEAMSDLIYLLDRLVDKDGKVLVPGIYDEVLPMTAEELATYKNIEFDIEERKFDIGTSRLIHEPDASRIMQGMWRYPTCSIHGIEGAFSEPGFKTVIPAKVTGKFSIRTVPNMGVETTEQKVLTYLNALWAARGSPNKAKFSVFDTSGRWYLENPESLNYRAARKAIEVVFGEEPALIREGGSIPITLVIRECAGTDVCLLPIGCSDDGAHSQNEKIDRANYLNGAKVMAEYFAQLAALRKTNPQ